MLLPLLFVAGVSHAAPAGLALDPARPPVPAGAVDGHPAWEFAPGVVWPVSDGVVLRLSPDAGPPAGARALGGPYWRVRTDDPVADALRWLGQPGVEDAFPDVLLARERRDFNDPSYGGQWYLDEIGMGPLLEFSLGSPEVRVGVIDSGIDISHPDLVNKVVDAYDAFADDDDPSPVPGEDCADPDSTELCDLHGTAVSGISTAEADNGVGIVGLCPGCSLVPIRLLGEGRGAMSADIAAFEHALAADAAVVNNSWGYTEYTPAPRALAQAIHDLATQARGGKGALVVFAAGNDDREIMEDEIEALDDVLCVSASDSYGYPTAYTNYGPEIDVSAPSATVTIAPDNQVITNFGGTSAAAPVVTGLAAWALSQDPELTAPELMALLVDTAQPSPYAGGEGHNDYYGWGVVNATAVYATLYPEGDDTAGEGGEPGGCACGTGPSPATAALGLAALTLLLPLRRREATC